MTPGQLPHDDQRSQRPGVQSRRRDRRAQPKGRGGQGDAEKEICDWAAWLLAFGDGLISTKIDETSALAKTNI